MAKSTHRPHKPSKRKHFEIKRLYSGFVAAGAVATLALSFAAVSGNAAAAHASTRRTPTPTPSHTPSPTPVPAVWSDAPASAIGSGLPLINWQSTSWNIYGGGSVSVVADPVKAKAIRFFGAGGQSGTNGGYANQRAEQLPNGSADTFVNNQTEYVGMDVKLNQGLGIANDWQELFQVKNDTEGSPSLAILANTHKEGLSIEHNTGGNGTPNYEQSIGATPYGTWARIVVGMHFTQSASTSWVEVWRDGVNIVPRESWSAYNQASGGPAGGLLYTNSTSGYLKFGVYRGPQPWDMDLRLANVKIGPALTNVQ